MSDAVIIHRPRGAGKDEQWGSTFAYSTIPSFHGLAVELLELEGQFPGSLPERSGWDETWQSDKTQGENMVPISLRAGQRHIYLHWGKFKFPKLILRNEDFLCVLLFLWTSSLCTLGDISLHCPQVRWSQRPWRAVCSSSSATALSGRGILIWNSK